MFALTLGTGSCRRRRFLPGASWTWMGLCLPKSLVLHKPCGSMWAASQAISLIPPKAPGAASCLPRAPPPLPTKGFSQACPHAPARRQTVHVILRRKFGILNSRFSFCPQFHPQIMMRDTAVQDPPPRQRPRKSFRAAHGSEGWTFRASPVSTPSPTSVSRS